jgi:drug/metabolite transporter (DMT)-like permease
MGSGVVEVILFALIVVAGTGGELCVSRAMKRVGEVKDFRPRAIVGVILCALRVGWMWAGVGMMALAFFSLLGALSFLNVSFVVPVTALSYVAGALGAVFFLRERVSSRRWAGVFLVSLGVTLVFLGHR